LPARSRPGNCIRAGFADPSEYGRGGYGPGYGMGPGMMGGCGGYGAGYGALKLSDDQRAKIAKIQEESRRQRWS